VIDTATFLLMTRPTGAAGSSARPRSSGRRLLIRIGSVATALAGLLGLGGGVFILYALLAGAGSSDAPAPFLVVLGLVLLVYGAVTLYLAHRQFTFRDHRLSAPKPVLALLVVPAAYLGTGYTSHEDAVRAAADISTGWILLGIALVPLALSYTASFVQDADDREAGRR
jgi:uncharacterized membrane protein YfcA